jgi:hypothetical protein
MPYSEPYLHAGPKLNFPPCDLVDVNIKKWADFNTRSTPLLTLSLSLPHYILSLPSTTTADSSRNFLYWRPNIPSLCEQPDGLL